MPGVLATEQPRARERVRGCALERGDSESFGTTLFSGETPCLGVRGSVHSPSTDGITYRFSKHPVLSIDICLVGPFFAKHPSREWDAFSS